MREEESREVASRLMHFADIEHQEKSMFLCQQQEYYLFLTLKPKFGIDGNQHYVLYGEDLQSGIAGFGDTLYKAILDFNNAFHKAVPQKSKESSEQQATQPAQH